MVAILKLTLALTVIAALTGFVIAAKAVGMAEAVPIALVCGGAALVATPVLVPLGLVAFGLPMNAYNPHQQAALLLAMPPGQALDRVDRELAAMGARVAETSAAEGFLVARTQASRRSHGEWVSVRVAAAEIEGADAEAKEMALVTIESRPVSRLQVCDFGKGRENVERIAARLTGSGPA
ncbi:MAG: hypothetical protein KDA64_09580 [Rhodospirillaceae bacterium]|nr:hypothetical protein [Rhodospirillaceae bacterium]